MTVPTTGPTMTVNGQQRPVTGVAAFQLTSPAWLARPVAAPGAWSRITRTPGPWTAVPPPAMTA